MGWLAGSSPSGEQSAMSSPRPVWLLEDGIGAKCAVFILVGVVGDNALNPLADHREPIVGERIDVARLLDRGGEAFGESERIIELPRQQQAGVARHGGSNDMTSQSLRGRCIGELEKFHQEIKTWSDKTNQKQRGVDRQFKIDDALGSFGVTRLLDQSRGVSVTVQQAQHGVDRG